MVEVSRLIVKVSSRKCWVTTGPWLDLLTHYFTGFWLMFKEKLCFEIVLEYSLKSLEYVVSGKKFVTYFFMKTPCNILPKYWYTYYPGTLLDRFTLSQDFKITTVRFLIFIPFLVRLNENSRNLTENSMSNSQIMKNHNKYVTLTLEG